MYSPEKTSTNTTETRLFKGVQRKFVILDLSKGASLLVSVGRTTHQRISFCRHDTELKHTITSS